MTATIYFYAQSLDNQSRDDIYYAKIGESLYYCEDSIQRQKVPLLMSKIVESSKKNIYEDDHLKIYVQFKKERKANMLVEFDTKQKDDLGRSSNSILVLEDFFFDVKRNGSYEEIVKRYQLDNYIIDFLNKTNRGSFVGEFYNIGAVLDKINLKKKILFIIKFFIFLVMVFSLIYLTHELLKIS